jgi:peptidyl-prolyl cis-trans isomerase B (cyclophilin B)
MAGQKREREVERARHERQQERRAEKRRKAKRRERILASVVVAVLAVGGLAYLGSVLRKDDGTTAASTPETSSNCAEPTGAQPASKTYEKPPAFTLNTKKTYTLTFATNCGDIAVELAAKDAPKNVSSMLGLANDSYFDNTVCHRLTTSGIFVLQCGDPKGDGTGGPGYHLPDENLPKAGTNNYPSGTVAMANAGPGTAGSQFFLVYGDTTLGPDYTIIGKITRGLDTILGVAAHGVTPAGSTDGTPQQTIEILGTDISSAKAGS